MEGDLETEPKPKRASHEHGEIGKDQDINLNPVVGSESSKFGADETVENDEVEKDGGSNLNPVAVAVAVSESSKLGLSSSERQSGKDGGGKEGGSNSEPTVRGFTGLISLWKAREAATLRAKSEGQAGKDGGVKEGGSNSEPTVQGVETDGGSNLNPVAVAVAVAVSECSKLGLSSSAGQSGKDGGGKEGGSNSEPTLEEFIRLTRERKAREAAALRRAKFRKAREAAALRRANSAGQSGKHGGGKERGSNSEPTLEAFTRLIRVEKALEAAALRRAKLDAEAGKSNTNLKQEQRPIRERLQGMYQLAMDFYCTTNGVEFEDVVPLGYNSIYAAGIYFHINFKAKPKIADSSADLSEKVFFGEVRFFMDEFTVLACCIVDPKTDADICHGCGLHHRPCKIYHPSSGFGAGRCSWVKSPPMSYAERFELFNYGSLPEAFPPWIRRPLPEAFPPWIRRP